MKIKTANYDYQILKSRKEKGAYWYDFGDGWKKAEHPDAIAAADRLLVILRKRKGPKAMSDIEAYNKYAPIIVSYENNNQTGTPDDLSFVIKDEPVEEPAIPLTMIAKSIIDFFSEFHFEPNFRFVNTFAFACSAGIEKANEYVKRYFELIDSPYASSVSEKMTSVEFCNIVSNVCNYATPTKVINKRFQLYYGSQGTGKTTKAMEFADNCIVCHSAMLPSDLMEDFKFIDGKADFQPSALWNAMVNGTTIVLDEINLLPFESLRFLQSILDGKEEFTYKGKVIRIAEGFQVIGTMNLVVNGCIYALPEPLVDRASNLKKFSLSEYDLVGAFA